MNIDIVCAGASVHPGDVIVGDVDGIVVVPRQDAAEVVRSCEARLAKEAKNRERLKAGELGLDMYGLREKLKNLGRGVGVVVEQAAAYVISEVAGRLPEESRRTGREDKAVSLASRENFPARLKPCPTEAN